MADSPRARSRVVRRLSAAFAGGLLLTFIPLPAPAFVATAVTDLSFLPLDQPVAAAEGLGESRVKGSATRVPTFDTLGVVLDEMPSEPVMVRVQTPDGAWGEWHELEVESDMGPELGSDEELDSTPAGSAVTEPIWVEEATGYEVSVGDGDATSVEVLVVREETQRVVVDAVPLAEAALPAPFGIQPRSSWGARAPKSTASKASALNLAVVHHTASSNDYSAAQVPGILRSIQAFHMDGNGWSDIAYNFLTDKYGGLWEGRGGGTAEPVIGAHARGFNTGSVGVAVLGNYVSVSSTAAAREAVSRVVGYRLQAYGVDPQGRTNVTSLGSTTIPAGRVVNLPTVVGHRDVGSTACPGSIQNHLGGIRNRAKDWFNLMESVSSPSGAISSVNVYGSNVDVIGWARDGDVPESPSRVHVVLAGRLNEAIANGYRPDVGRAYPGHGDFRGWGTGFRQVPPGTHRLCVTVINQGHGSNKLLGCQDVVVK